MKPIEHWLELLTAERDRRQKIDGSDSGARERFLEELAEIGRRLRTGPGCILEPTPAEIAELEAQLSALGYGVSG